MAHGSYRSTPHLSDPDQQDRTELRARRMAVLRARHFVLAYQRRNPQHPDLPELRARLAAAESYLRELEVVS